MRFGIFLQHYFPYGGLQRDAVRLAEAAVEAGDEPILIVSTWEGPKPTGFEIVELRAGGASNHKKAKNFAEACEATYQTHSLETAICFSRVPGTPFHFCGDPCYKERFVRTKSALAKLLPRYRYLLKAEEELFGASSNTHIFFLAESEIPAYKQYYPLPKTLYTLLPPWLKRPKEFSKSKAELKKELASQYGIQAADKILLFVGSDFHRKGLDRAIEALADLKDTSIHLVACGKDDATKYDKLAADLGVAPQIHILGPRDDIPEWMYISDLLIHPARQETAGMVLLEALTYNLPVLCTENCGYSTAVKEAGFLPLPTTSEPTKIGERYTETLSELLSPRDQTLNWIAQPSRFSTASLILERIRLSAETLII